MYPEAVLHRLTALEATTSMLVQALAALTFDGSQRTSGRAAAWDGDLNLQRREEATIQEALRRTHGNQKEAARLLGITPRAINYTLLHGQKRLRLLGKRRTA